MRRFRPSAAARLRLERTTRACGQHRATTSADPSDEPLSNTTTSRNDHPSARAASNVSAITAAPLWHKTHSVTSQTLNDFSVIASRVCAAMAHPRAGHRTWPCPPT